MYEMFTMLGSVDRVRPRDFEKCWPGIQESLGSTIFGQKVRTASEKERQLLVKMANSGEEFASPSDMKQPSELFSRLEKKELLIRHQRGRYRVFHPLFSEYLRKL
jgi:predicted transcriptional regulator of viral defense system